MSEAFCKDCPRRAKIIEAIYAEAIQANAMNGGQLMVPEVDVPIDNTVCIGVDLLTRKRTGIAKILGDKTLKSCSKPTIVRIPEQQSHSASADSSQPIQ